MLEGILYQEFGTGCTYSLYKRRIFADIRFPFGLYYEDLAVTHKVHALCRRVAVTNEYMYGYRYNPASIMQGSYSPKVLSCIPISEQLYSYVSKEFPELRNAAASRAFSANRTAYFKIPYGLKEERGRVWAEILKYRNDVIFDPRARKRERIAALCTYLGAPLFSIIFSGMYRRYQMRI